MADTNDEPLSKKIKTDESKCVRCNRFIRKTAGPAKLINTREDAKKIHEDIELLVQVGDVLCQKCCSQLRLQKSITKRQLQKQTDELASKSNPRQNISLISEQEMPYEVVDQEPHSFTPPEQDTDSATPINSKSASQDSLTSFNQFSQSSTDDPSYVPAMQTPSVEIIEMSFPRVIMSHAYCFICRSRDDIRDVPFEARMQAFVKRRIFIPRRNKCCNKHLIKKRFFEEEVAEIRVVSNECSIEVTEIKKFMDKLFNKVNARLHEHIGDYSISEERVKALTGHTWENIILLHNMMSTMRDSKNCNITQALVIFLCKLRSGNSDNLISAILDVDEKKVTNSINAVLKCFKDHVLPKHFGIHAHSREFFISHTAASANRLHNLDNRLALICDATYLRHKKSANNAYQRKSYSDQKKTALCKPFTICTTDGFIVDVPRPFNATKNDAQILEYLLTLPNGFSNILKKGDIFVLDRGFRDVKSLLEEKVKEATARGGEVDC
ncbi:vacuolar protein sorting-associated protein 13c [Lasius niger]|uniref:Vacuolar protein sorting-associated protein 13c n=1 Tax=Lasius niger TaxID=67767 RepID=A0A0J7K9B1_LASNI|nr:vacuolar protein sorting-associated protein 13c [Lasius niger]